MTSFKCIESLEENPVDIFLQVTEILLKLIDNVLLYPSDPKYRKLRLGNKLVSTVIMPSIGAMECLFEIGFQEDDDALLLPPEKTSVEKLSLFRTEISNRRSKRLKVGTSSTNDKSDKVETSSKKDLTKQATSLKSSPTTSTTKQAEAQFSPSTSTTKQAEAQSQSKQTATSTISAAQQPGPSTALKRPEIHSQPASTSITNSTNSFLSKLDTLSAMVLQYERKATKEKVLSVVPVHEISERVESKMRENQRQVLKSSQEVNEATLQEVIFVTELMKWFKDDFFEWVDKPKCLGCKCDTKFLEMSSNKEEKIETDRVEVYKCGNCSARVLFPRFNSIDKLMTTRRGRCGEWANAFTAVCRALGWDARFISDQTDHAWTEVYFKSEGRWVHCDPCECVLDKPLLYEKGWRKQLSYILAFSCEDIQDVTWRYSAKHKEVLAHRNMCSELQLVMKINELNRLRQQNLTAKRKKLLAKRTLMELVQLMQPAMEQEGDDEGRKSGSLSWRLERLETTVAQAYTPYVWTPTSHEIESKKMVISYNTAIDEYKRLHGESTKGWKARVFFVENVFRKEEKDWKTAYLCRTEGSVEGCIKWQIDLTDSGLQVDRVEVRCPSTTFETGKVMWLLCAGDKCMKIQNGEIISSELRGSTLLTLSVTMTGGKGDVAWQHAQIFRQPLDALEPEFQISLTFTKSS